MTAGEIIRILASVKPVDVKKNIISLLTAIKCAKGKLVKVGNVHC